MRGRDQHDGRHRLPVCVLGAGLSVWGCGREADLHLRRHVLGQPVLCGDRRAVHALLPLHHCRLRLHRPDVQGQARVPDGRLHLDHPAGHFLAIGQRRLVERHECAQEHDGHRPGRPLLGRLQELHVLAVQLLLAQYQSGKRERDIFCFFITQIGNQSSPTIK